MAMGPLRRVNTDIGDADEGRPAHKFFIRRPRYRQVRSESTSLRLEASHISNGGPNTHVPEHLRHEFEPISAAEPETDDLAEKQRFELLIDLIWVGIVSNLADNFSEEAYSLDSSVGVGQAIGNFTLLFLIAWRLWKYLQDFMTQYATNDIVERLFVFWILALATIYGNTAPYLFADKDQTNLAIPVYLVARGSIYVLECVYAIFLPSLRRSCLLRLALIGPITAPYIIALWLDDRAKAGLIGLGIALDYWVQFIVSMPFARKALSEDAETVYDIDHFVERIRDFFIIIIGDGVINLIRGGPLGRGLTSQAGAGITSLGIYFVIGGLYFNGDLSHRYVHAAKRTWWRAQLWLSTHVIMFESMLALESALDFIVAHPLVNSLIPRDGGDANPERLLFKRDNSTDVGGEPEVPLQEFMERAKWSAGISLAIVLTCLTALAVSSKSLDQPGTFKIDNRFIRMAGRIVVIILAVFIAFPKDMSGVVMILILLPPMSVALGWEWYTSLDKAGMIWEKDA